MTIVSALLAGASLAILVEIDVTEETSWTGFCSLPACWLQRPTLQGRLCSSHTFISPKRLKAVLPDTDATFKMHTYKLVFGAHLFNSPRARDRNHSLGAFVSHQHQPLRARSIDEHCGRSGCICCGPDRASHSVCASAPVVSAQRSNSILVASRTRNRSII